LDDDLEIFPNIDTKHFVHASKRLIGGQFAEVGHEPLEEEKD
jgi:hypothetical protein